MLSKTISSENKRKRTERKSKTKNFKTKKK